MKTSTKQLIGEFFASFMLAYFGLGTIVALAIYKTVSDTFEFGLFFGLVVAIVIVITNPISGAHFNPAVTISMAASKRMSWRMVIPYIVTQVAGWWAGAMLLYATFGPDITEFEAANGIIRGSAESVSTATIFFCATTADLLIAFLVEFMITALLLVSICSFIDQRNAWRPSNALFPIMIGFIVAIDITFAGPITGAALNPARDFGPRIAAWMMGWGQVAFPGTYWYMYWIGPILGGICGTFFYDKFLGKCLTTIDETCEEEKIKETTEKKAAKASL